MVQIDNHIPLPGGARKHRNARGHATQYPFYEMEIGDSVFFPGEFTDVHDCKPYEYAKTIQRRNKAYRFSGRVRTEDGRRGARIWRTD